MTATDFRASIERVVTACWEQKFLLDSTSPVLAPAGKLGAVRVTWSSSTALRLDPVATFESYRRLLFERQFTILLLDHSIVQISAVFERDVLARQRYSFFPCPFDPLPSEVVVDGLPLLDVVDGWDADTLVKRLGCGSSPTLPEGRDVDHLILRRWRLRAGSGSGMAPPA